MVIKLELKKMHDHTEWSFIEDTMKDARVPYNLRKIVMNCNRSGSCRLLWNDVITASINTSRGLRQSDPLSSYMFVLCLERLSQWINKEVTQVDVEDNQGFKIGASHFPSFLRK